jgi:hypothetical protein
MSKILFLKAEIPAGARWITVHPNGPGTDGQPVLIQPNPDGSAHVIGGAGGKLNYLKLRGVRSESDYKADAAKRKAEKAEAKKAKAKADKEAGIAESKKKAREAVAAQQRAHEKKFIGKVGEKLGWNKDEIEFKPEKYDGVSDAAMNKLAAKHHRELLKKATEAVDLQRQRLVTDSAARTEAGIGEVPLESQSPDTITVEDLNPVPQQSGGLGYSTNYKERAEKAGLSADELKKEGDTLSAEKAATKTDAQRAAAVKRGETAKMIGEELKAIREPIVSKSDPTLIDAKDAVDLLREQKALKQAMKQARAANSEIDRAVSEPKAYVIQYTADPDADAKIAQDIDDELRTAQTTAFLSEVHKLAGDDPTETLGKHIGIGAYNSINSLALAVGGEALVDRSVVDVLGIAGAAQVLARRIHADMPDAVEHVTEGVQDFHLHHYMQSSADALSQARDLMDAAKDIELGEAANGADLQVAQELNARRRGAVSDAQKILGQTLGEMEANAALAVALKQGAKDKFEVSLGKTASENAIQQVRAIGLQRGDYQIETVAGDTFLTINAAGLDRLSKPIARADIEQVKNNLSIIHGDQDQDDWLPMGVANRPDLAMDVKPGVAPRIAEPFAPGADLEQSLRDYIGGRAADGDAPGDIVADIQSGDFFDKVGDDRREAYRAALDSVAPLKGEDGNMQRAEVLGDKFDEYADQFVEGRHGAKRSPLNRQKFAVDQKAVDALHRALAETPEGASAYKQIGELTNQDQRALREFFYANVAKESPDAAATRQSLEHLNANEPEKEVEDMFGDKAVNPEWQDWKQQRDDTAAQLKGESLNWAQYAETMRGHEKAYEAVQDLIRSKISKSFADIHNKLNPDSPVKLGKAVVRNNLNHLDAVDPVAREERMRNERELMDGLRERVQGRYASGSVKDKMDAARESKEAFEQSQMGFFGGDDQTDMFGGGDEAPAAPELAGDERHTLGHEAERQIAGMMPIVGQNFRSGQPVKLWNPTMSGGKNAARQRLVKMVDQNKRVVAAFGTGSGKSLLQLASFTHLHGQGKVKRGLFLVPSIVQGQFSGEALRYLEPGKFNWNIEPGASRDARIAAYKNPDHHFCVMTHQSFRDDMMHLGAKAEGISEGDMSNRLNAMSDGERKDWMHGIMQREGINFDYLTVDESQNTLNRAGKENSGMANVVDALSHHTPYYLNASGDPVKNDASEVYDLMRKMDPARYPDRAAFMRRYGADTLASKEALRREMARYVYPSKIDPDVTADRKEHKLELSAGQKGALGELDRAFANARLARMQGKVDVAAMRQISPSSFEGIGEHLQEGVARDLQKNLGILRSSAVNRVINTHPDNPNVDNVAKVASDRKGKPGVVFAHSLEAVNMLKKRLESEGHRVVTITGSDSSKEKERKRLMFNPESGEPEADILLASDAGATGMNIQRGQWLYQYDTPQTAMTHAQRNGRIFRTGQKNNVELIDGVPNHPEVHKARDRLQKKYGLRELMTTPLEGLDESGVAYYIKQRQAAQQDDSQGGLF